MWGMCKCGVAETLKSNTKTEAAVDADSASCVRFRCMSLGRNRKRLPSDLLPGLPVHPGRKIRTTSFFHTVGGQLFSGQLDSGLPRRGYTDRFTKLLAVACDDGDLAPPTAGSHVEQFLFHSVCRDDDCIYRFTLASMGGDGVSVCEFVIVRGECSSIFKTNGSAIQGTHCNQLSVGCPEFRPSTVSRQHQAVARGNFSGLTFINGKR